MIIHLTYPRLKHIIFDLIPYYESFLILKLLLSQYLIFNILIFYFVLSLTLPFATFDYQLLQLLQENLHRGKKSLICNCSTIANGTELKRFLGEKKCEREIL